MKPSQTIENTRSTLRHSNPHGVMRTAFLSEVTVNHWVGGSSPSRGANVYAACSEFSHRPFFYYSDELLVFFIALVGLLSLGNALASDCAGSCGCDNGFTGELVTYWPNSPTTYEAGVLFDAPADNGGTTYFNISGRDYAVPDSAMVRVAVIYATCRFNIGYDGDPVFAGGFD